MRTLVVTNDFPPRAGGIQAMVQSLAARQPEGEIVVYAPNWPGSRAYDRAQPFPVVRHPTSLMLPEPSVLRRARDLLRAERCDRVWFGAAAPLALLAPALRRAGAERLVASTHGHEAGWAQLPGARSLLRRIGREVDTMTYLGEYTRTRLAAAMGPDARLVRLAPGVDVDAFSPAVDGGPVRARYGLGERPVIVCVSRLVRRKGQDMLIRALPAVLRQIPDAMLLLVSDGPDAQRLRRLASGLGVGAAVRYTGAVPWRDLPGCYAAGTVFAMPCRTRRGGLDVEGLGIVYLEAAASCLPVVAGNSGGAPDAVVDGATGTVVDGRSLSAVAGALLRLLTSPADARAMGLRGRAEVEREWRWELQAARLRSILAG